jgi:hypothetical protein
MNPYFVISTILLLGLRGIEKKIALPGPPVSAYIGKDARDKSEIRKLAASLEEATKLMMRKESIAREVFGDEFVEHFGGTREHEVGLWNEAVTNWECESHFHSSDSRVMMRCSGEIFGTRLGLFVYFSSNQNIQGNMSISDKVILWPRSCFGSSLLVLL